LELTAAEKRALIARHFLLGALPPAALDRLAAYARFRSFPAGHAIFHKQDRADSMLVVVEGRVLISASSQSGREIVLNLIDEGEVFGEIGLIDGGTRSAQAQALEDTLCLELERRHFLPLLEENPRLAIELLGVVCRKLRSTTEDVEDIAFLELKPRLAKKLLAFAQHFGRDKPTGRVITLALTQQRLAAMLGATRETVNRTLAELTEQGVLEVRRGACTITNPARLAEIASGS
jgi:CRP-like cAMP-binding protein